MRLLCHLGFHNWVGWTEPTIKGIHYTQKSKCSHCGLWWVRTAIHWGDFRK